MVEEGREELVGRRESEGARRRGKPSILLSLSCVCLQRTSIEGGWRGTRVRERRGYRAWGCKGESRIRGGGGTVTEKYTKRASERVRGEGR